MKKTDTTNSVLEELYDYVEIEDEAYWIRKDFDQKKKNVFIEEVKKWHKEFNSKEFKEWRKKWILENEKD